MLKHVVCAFMLVITHSISSMELTESELLEEIRAKKNCLHELPFTHVIIQQTTRDMQTQRSMSKFPHPIDPETIFVSAAACNKYPTLSQAYDIAKGVLSGFGNNLEKPKFERASLDTILSNVHLEYPHLEELDPYSFACITFFKSAVTIGGVYKGSSPSILTFNNKYAANVTHLLPAQNDNERIFFSMPVDTIHDTNALVLLGGAAHSQRATNALMHHKGDMKETIKKLHEGSRLYNDMYTMSVTYMTAAAYLCAYDKQEASAAK